MKNQVQNLSIGDFTYELPADRIAKKPAENRSGSKLLIYENQHISESTFDQLPQVLDPNSHLVFNNTKVVQARIIFQNRNGRDIEIFCLEPAGENIDLSIAMSTQKSTQWICLVGGAKKWKEPFLAISDQNGFELKAELTERLDGEFLITFNWTPEQLTFSEVLENVGKIPLPPYIKRDVTDSDKDRYQTVFAKEEGSVAAPTAGLHFTKNILHQLQSQQISSSQITLHVGAGTFKPVSSDTMKDHPMHAEWIEVDLSTIQELATTDKRITPVGTTSMRTLESLYWFGVKILTHPETNLSELGQWDAYELPQDYSKTEALNALAGYLEANKVTHFMAKSRLIIAPGYTPRICGALITNFHQPGSTLLLLVSALVGENWKDIYQYALQNDFRFLSYGDSNYLKF
ncbi:S-adenosylmethionine:tRNA ribosyltransferase-isomerase [bacterium SCSIO 12643]|nr:S-adenosylmethionine:tRNA ribosyltransferase-isomerase [bacterium SCSIO 12643]